MRRVERRIVSVMNGESIICVATSKSKWKGRKQDNTRVKETVAFYSNSSTTEE